MQEARGRLREEERRLERDFRDKLPIAEGDLRLLAAVRAGYLEHNGPRLVRRAAAS